MNNIQSKHVTPCVSTKKYHPDIRRACLPTPVYAQMEVCDIACNVLVYKHRSTDIIIAGSFDVDRMSSHRLTIPISHIAMTLSQSEAGHTDTQTWNRKIGYSHDGESELYSI